MPSLGLAYDRLERVNPRVVLVSISNYGQTGPYRDYRASETTLYGMGGSLGSRGGPDRVPVKYGKEAALRQAGLIRATATMAALFMREQRAAGEHVDVLIFETRAGGQDSRNPDVIKHRFIGDMTAHRAPAMNMAAGVSPCKNGYINLSALGRRSDLNTYRVSES